MHFKKVRALIENDSVPALDITSCICASVFCLHSGTPIHTRLMPVPNALEPTPVPGAAWQVIAMAKG